MLKDFFSNTTILIASFTVIFPLHKYKTEGVNPSVLYIFLHFLSKSYLFFIIISKFSCISVKKNVKFS